MAGGSWAVVSQANTQVVAIHTVVLPNGTVLFFERPHEEANYPSNGPLSALLNLSTWGVARPFVARNPFCAGHLVLPDGRALVAGGDKLAASGVVDGRQALRLFSSETGGWIDVGSITTTRWYPTVKLLPDGRVFIVGGSDDDNVRFRPNFEVLPPSPGNAANGTYLGFLQAAEPWVLYPHVHVLPTGWLFFFVNRTTRFVHSATFEVQDYSIGDLGAYPRNYTDTACSVLLPLLPENGYLADVLLLGGNTSSNWGDSASPATVAASRIRTNDPQTPPSWQPDDMPAQLERCMPDAVLLPDGTVAVVNGLSYGRAGGGAGDSTGFAAQLATTIYDPTKPAGSRWSASGVLSSATVPRRYHSTAFLLPDATVMTAGCDQSTAPGNPFETRMEVFTPPYLSLPAARPVIQSAPPRVTYGMPFTVTIQGGAAADRAVLIAPSAVTHSTNMHQRCVGLSAFTNTGPQTYSMVAPPNAMIAPPGPYMLFLLNAGKPSVAAWVQVGDNVQHPSVSLTSGLVGWWKLNEGAGTTLADASGNGHTGTVSGPTSWVPDRGTTVLKFDGAGTAATVPNVALPLGNAPRTIAVWFKVPNVTTNRTLWSYGVTATGQGCGVCIHPGIVRFFGWGEDVEARVNLKPDTWYHVAVTFAAPVATIYINGQVQFSSPAPAWSTAAGDTLLHIGEVTDHSQRFEGVLSDLCVYNRALTPSEVMLVAARIPSHDLALWLTAEAGVLTDANSNVISWADRSGSGNDARALTFGSGPTLDQTALPFLSFSGGAGCDLTTASAMPAGSGAYSIFVVGTPTANGARGLIGWGNWGASNQVNAFRMTDAGALDNYWWGNDIISPSTQPIPLRVRSLLAATYDGSTRTLWRNASPLATLTQGGRQTAATPATIGLTYPAGNEYFSGGICEILVYNGLLSAAEIQAVQAYLNAKYAAWGKIPEGAAIALRCLGTNWNPAYVCLDGRTGDGSVGLAPGTGGGYSGTHWRVEYLDVAGDVIALRCLGSITNPAYVYLDGRTGDGSVGLAPGTGGGYSGTHWQVQYLSDGIVALKCLGSIVNASYVYLDGRTGDGSVGLGPDTGAAHSGAHWTFELL